MTDRSIEVGGSADADGAAFVAAWHRADGGDLTCDESFVFETWEALSRVLTTERLRLLRHVHAAPAASIMALATALGRQYRRVHDDVAILTDVGLLDRGNGFIRATASRIRTTIELA